MFRIPKGVGEKWVLSKHRQANVENQSIIIIPYSLYESVENKNTLIYC